MNKFEIIEDEHRWNKALGRFENPDCYYSYIYGSLFAGIEKGSIYAAYYEDEKGKVFYPYIKRKVPLIKQNVYDIVTPYGYGGPLLEGNIEVIEDFYNEFGSYCKKNNVITETIRFHPLYENHQLMQHLMNIGYIRKTTAVDLTSSIEEIRDNYSSMNKRNIKKAMSNGLTCFIAENDYENLKIFMDLYKETMDRNQAVSYYYFDEEYFLNQLKETDTSKTFLLFTKREDEIVAGVMVLVGREYSHYHLGASMTKYLEMKPNNLLFDYMIEFCKIRGSKTLHLGGGYSEDDGLFKFKSSFTNQNHYNYYIGKKIHENVWYQQIIEQFKEKYVLDENYFPAYRGQRKAKSNT